jgi:hypothetical protein
VVTVLPPSPKIDDLLPLAVLPLPPLTERPVPAGDRD